MTMLSNLAAFDMDGTLIQGRLVFELADRFDLSDKVRLIQSHRLMSGHEQTKAIAHYLQALQEKTWNLLLHQYLSPSIVSVQFPH